MHWIEFTNETNFAFKLSKGSNWKWVRFSRLWLHHVIETFGAKDKTFIKNYRSNDRNKIPRLSFICRLDEEHDVWCSYAQVAHHTSFVHTIYKCTKQLWCKCQDMQNISNTAKTLIVSCVTSEENDALPIHMDGYVCDAMPGLREYRCLVDVND